MEGKIKLFLETLPFYSHLKGRGLFLVGGTIRDLLLNREPRDIDLVIFGEPDEFVKELRKEVGGAYVPLDENTVRLVLDEWVVDVSRNRGDNILEDLYRRDFTINSIAYSIDGGFLVDPMKGVSDIREKVIRVNSREAFQEDPLRMLRAFRFVSVLDFQMDYATYREISSMKNLIEKVAAERVHFELMELFAGRNFYEATRMAVESGLFFVLFPELEALSRPLEHVEQNILEHTLNVLKYLNFYMNHLDMSPFLHFLKRFELLKEPENRAILAIAALFHDVAKPPTYSYENGEVHFYGHDTEGAKMFKKIGKRLAFSRNQIKAISLLIANHMHPHYLSQPEVTVKAINRFLNRLGEWAFPAVLLAFSDALATKLSGYGVSGHIKLAKIMEDILRRKEAEASKPPRLITGHDLIDMGLKPSPLFKKILQEIDDLQAEGKIRTREEALKILPEIVEKFREEADKSL